MLATLLEASLCLWHLCTRRRNNWLGGVVKACDAFWQQLLFWEHCLFIYLFFSDLFYVSIAHTITVHQSCKDMACGQIKHAAPLNSDSICTGSSSEIIFECNIISKNSAFHFLKRKILKNLWSHCLVWFQSTRLYADALRSVLHAHNHCQNIIHTLTYMYT